MRFELRFRRMQKLNRLGIKTLADLKDSKKVNSLQHFLLSAWKGVLLYDNSINLNSALVKPRKGSYCTMGKIPNTGKVKKDVFQRPDSTRHDANLKA